MKKRIILIATFLVLAVASLSLAATNIRIAANIGETHQMNVVLNKVIAGAWSTITDLVADGMDFGNLVKGADNVLRSDAYFVVDAPVISNKTGWTITHSATSFVSGVNNLNANANVKFIKVDNTTNAETLLASNSYISYSTAMTRPAIAQSELTGGRLRIYYSLASGSGDATGVTVITTAKPVGLYVGTVTLTLSP